MKIIVCGDRHWTDQDYIYDVLNADLQTYKTFTIIEGGATGADEIAKEFGKQHGLPVLSIKPNWNKYGLRAGPIRNQKMLNLKPDFVYAFHNNIQSSRGTRNMINIAKGLVPVTLYYIEDGERKFKTYHTSVLYLPGTKR